MLVEGIRSVQQVVQGSCSLLLLTADASYAARRAIKELEGDASQHLDDFADASTDRYAAMVERIRQRLGLTTLCYQKLPDMVAAISLPRERLCTFCWNGEALHEEA